MEERPRGGGEEERVRSDPPGLARLLGQWAVGGAVGRTIVESIPDQDFPNGRTPTCVSLILRHARKIACECHRISLQAIAPALVADGGDRNTAPRVGTRASRGGRGAWGKGEPGYPRSALRRSPEYFGYSFFKQSGQTPWLNSASECSLIYTSILFQ